MFAGWLRLAEQGPGPSADQLLGAIDPFGAAASSGTHSTADLVLAATRIAPSARDDRTSLPAVNECTGTIAVGWLRLSNRADLLTLLDLHRPPEEISDLDLALAAYERWGDDAAGHLTGEFALAVWDPARRHVYLARDPLGTRPLFATRTPQAAAFGTTLAAFKGLPGIPADPDPLWLACYIADLPGGVTGPLALVGAQRIPAGHWGHLDADGLRTQRYHHFRDDALWANHRDPQWLEAYREELMRAVGFAANCEGILGIESSGGLDSSTLVALSARSRPDGGRSIHGLGYAIFELEPQFILATAAMWEVYTNHIFTRWDNGTPAQFHARKQMFDTAVGHPCQHGSVLGHFEVLDMARRNGIHVLLSGFGGDEGVTNQGFNVLGELADRGDWAAVTRHFTGRALTRPLRARKWAWQRQRRSGKHSPIGPRSERALALFTPEIAEALRTLIEDEPGHPSYNGPARTGDPTTETVNAEVLRRLHHPNRDIRLEQGAVFASAFGIEYRWPLLDADLIQQYLTTPAVWKMANGQGRYLHRAAMAGLLPQHVLEYAPKHMGARSPTARAFAANGVPDQNEGTDFALSPSEVPQSVIDLFGNGLPDSSGPGAGVAFRTLRVEKWVAGVERLGAGSKPELFEKE